MKSFRLLGALVIVSVLSGTASAVELKVFEWEGYVSLYEKDFEAWAKSKGKDIDLVLLKKPDGSNYYIGNADDIFEQVRRKACDVVTPTHNYFKQERGKLMQLLLPLDTDRIPNYQQVYPGLRSAGYAREADGKVRALPLLGGSYALAYDSAKGPAPASWTDLLKPEAKGSFAITSDQYEANIYQMALLAGVKPADVYDYDKITPEQRTQTAEYLKTLVANAGSFWSGMPSVEQMASLKYVTDYWFGVAAANAAGQQWKFAEPKEGVTVWLDNVSISGHLANEPEKLDAAYMLLDYMVGVDAQAAIARAFGSVIVNPAAKAMLSPEQAAAQPGENFFAEERFWQPLSDRTRGGFKKMWDDALAAAGKK